MPAKVPESKISRILADAKLTSVAEAAAKHGICSATITRYRAELDPSSPLAAEIEQLVREADDWRSGIPATLEALVSYLRIAATSKSADDPAVIRAVTSAFSALAEYSLAEKILGENR